MIVTAEVWSGISEGAESRRGNGNVRAGVGGGKAMDRLQGGEPGLPSLAKN